MELDCRTLPIFRLSCKKLSRGGPPAGGRYSAPPRPHVNISCIFNKILLGKYDCSVNVASFFDDLPD